MTNFGQERVCRERRKHSDGRQSAISNRRITNLGQKRSCCERSIMFSSIKSVCSRRRITNLGRNWSCCYRRITIPGQDWSYFNRIEHSDGRDNACSCRRITNLGQEWSFFGGSITIFGQDWSCCVFTKLFLLSYSGFRLTAKPPPGTALSFSMVLQFTVFREMT